jgi:hypothetical protein
VDFGGSVGEILENNIMLDLILFQNLLPAQGPHACLPSAERIGHS